MNKKNETLTPCPFCRGVGSFHEGGAYLPAGGYNEPCDMCKSTGKVPVWLKMQYLRDLKAFKKERLKQFEALYKE